MRAYGVNGVALQRITMRPESSTKALIIRMNHSTYLTLRAALAKSGRHIVPMAVFCTATLLSSAALAGNAFEGATVTDTCVSCPNDKFGAPSTLVDGNVATMRNLGAGAPGAFTITLAKSVSLNKVVVVPAMTPNGAVSFEVQTSKDAAGVAGSWISHGGILTKEWSDKAPVEITMNPETVDVRAVKVTIHKSPSWIAVYEIEGESSLGKWVYAVAILAALLLLGGLLFWRRRRTAAV